MPFFRISLIALLLGGTLTAGDLDQYGGLSAVQKKATGFFRVETVNDRWCFITPMGHPFIAIGANHVGKYLSEQAAEGGLLSNHNNDATKSAEALLKSLNDLGFTAGDAYQPHPQFSDRLPWVKSFHYTKEGSRKPPNIFDDEEVKAMHEHVKSVCETIADNPRVLGVAGPDLPRWDSSYVDPYRLAEPKSSARRGYESFLKTRHDTVEHFNTAYKTRFASWREVEDKPLLKLSAKSDTAKKDEEAFLALIAAKHFAALRAACKAGAPNHLFLGERTQLRVIPEAVLVEMGKHIDVFCTQSLIRLPKSPPEWQLFQQKHYDHEYQLVQKPVIIIDWAAPFTLGPNPDKTKYGTLQPETRSGEDAANFVHSAFDAPYLIGLFVCQVIGTHGNDSFFNQAKRTYLKDDGSAWPARTALLREANRKVIQKLYTEFTE